MEDADGLSFDFEGGLDSGPSHSFSPGCSTRKLILRRRKPDTKLRSFLRDGSRSWKRTGLPSDCLQTLASRSVYESRSLRVPPSVRQSSYAYLPVLPVTRECREQDCVYKHTNADIKECNMYKLGFCPNGSDCRYRHAKLSGPPPPVEEVLQKIQQLTSYNHGPNRFYQPRNVAPQLGDVKPQVQFQTQGQLQESGNLQQQQPQQTQHQVSQTQTPNPAEQTSHAHPLPRGGCAKMTSRIGGYIGGENWKHEHGTAQFGRNFSVTWLKLCELSFHKTRNLRNPYNENLPVKISRDCQELEPSVGEELASLLYLEPDSDLMAISIAAEAKREEEKAKGVNPESRAENPDIVPFEDNEEEEEDDDESEEEEDGMANGPQGRGRGRGMMWPPQMPLGRGIRPMPGMGGFPLGVMAPSHAFPYGPGGYNGMPDPFGMGGPRPFGPRFGGDFRGPVPGMMFPGRPPQQFPRGGYGMMGRGPVMGGMGNAAPRGGGGRPMYHPPATTTTSVRPASSNRRTPERSDDRGVAVDEHTSHGMEQSEGGNSLRNEESGSEDEDEAPRRSRHGEGKKRW
ncbi:unnamed protein product [Brassica oleracea var. botrytis]